MRNHKAQVRAFTLVELLVVMGVIALLIGILFPVLSSARRQANTTKCASNLRQIAMGWQIYANAHKGTACPGRPAELPAPSKNLYSVGNGDMYRPRWYALLGAETGMSPFVNPSTAESASNSASIENPVFLCPEVPEWTNARNYPFGYNFQFLGNMRLKNTGRGYVNFPVKVSHIKAAETVMAADSMGTAAGKPKSQRAAYQPDGAGDHDAVGNHGWSIDPPRLTPLSDYSDYANRSPADRSAPDPRHRGKANVAFCDGHVELMGLQDMGYTVFDDGSVAEEGNGAHNRLFSGTGQDVDPPSVE